MADGGRETKTDTDCQWPVAVCSVAQTDTAVAVVPAQSSLIIQKPGLS